MDTAKAKSASREIVSDTQQEPRAPETDEERQVYQEVMEAIEADEWIEYASVDEMLEDMRRKAAKLKR